MRTLRSWKVMTSFARALFKDSARVASSLLFAGSLACSTSSQGEDRVGQLLAQVVGDSTFTSVALPMRLPEIAKRRPASSPTEYGRIESVGRIEVRYFGERGES